eukprot:TRINITY_DN70389_c0_g1_i1.p1 TRINITY_DN70389_c0_g1~~TRINITY_DN70389_c0_g1_i1.p1  ORF type:complete len:171 (+),score=31.69 TRINITY_DN70389_c0_g1_i1:144-656(+)
MGTPSGSKNCNILTDRLDHQASMWERPVYDTKHITNEGGPDKNLELKLEKMQKMSELDEWRQLKSGARIDQKILKIERVASFTKVEKSVGPAVAPEKRGPVVNRLPGFLKMKNKDASVVHEDQPDEKRRRLDQEGGSVQTVAASPPPEPTTSPAGGSLVGYGSDSSDDDA